VESCRRLIKQIQPSNNLDASLTIYEENESGECVDKVMTINISENPPAIEGKVLSFDNVMLDPGNHCVLVTPGLVAAAGFDTVLSDAITENGEWTFCVSYPVEIISRNPKGCSE